MVINAFFSEKNYSSSRVQGKLHELPGTSKQVSDVRPLVHKIDKRRPSSVIVIAGGCPLMRRAQAAGQWLNLGS